MTEPIQIIHLNEVIARLKNPKWAYDATQKLFSRWRFFVEGKAKANIGSGESKWLWKAETRRSLTSDVVPPNGWPREARVGSDLVKARWGDMGTGLLSEDPESPKRRYFPPIAALQPWSQAHDLNAGAVAYGIYKRGGTKPRRFLRNAYDEGQRALPGFLVQAVKEMESAASHGP